MNSVVSYLSIEHTHTKMHRCYCEMFVFRKIDDGILLFLSPSFRPRLFPAYPSFTQIILKALEEGKIVRVRTNYRISPEHARALNLPVKQRGRGGGSGSKSGNKKADVAGGKGDQSEGGKVSSTKSSVGKSAMAKDSGGGGGGGGSKGDRYSSGHDRQSKDSVGDGEVSKGVTAVDKRSAEGWQEMAKLKTDRISTADQGPGVVSDAGAAGKEGDRKHLVGKDADESKHQAYGKAKEGGEDHTGKANQGASVGENGKKEAAATVVVKEKDDRQEVGVKGVQQEEASVVKEGDEREEQEGMTEDGKQETPKKGKGKSDKKRGNERRSRPMEKAGSRKGRPPKTMGGESGGGGGGGGSGGGSVCSMVRNEGGLC